MLLPLKLLITPLLIAFVTLVGRKWGPGVGGWLMGFPLTSGPVSMLLALQYGKDFAAHAAIGTLGGQASVCVFCLTYFYVSQAVAWPISAAVSLAAFFVSVFCWNAAGLSLLPAFVVSVSICAIILLSLPGRSTEVRGASSPKWDIPARMVAAATFVLLLTSAANTLGSQLSGLLTPFPLFGVIIASFTHHQQGAVAAGQMLRGVVMGSFAFSSFFLVVALLLPVFGVGWTYAAATLAALAINSIALRRLKKESFPIGA
ncbi:MAG: hypothetical protein HGA53_02540 [Anaerolineaceae bacterium]|nr:hypothetical protein [Anaerolineaceae bacterium]